MVCIMLKERVKNPVHFVWFRDGNLWYRCFDGWDFPVPVQETTNSQGASPTFHAEEKGITLMRWIRRHLELERSGSEA